MKNSAIIAEELTSLQTSKNQLGLRFSQLETEHRSLLSQIEIVAPFLDTVEKELNLHIREITSLRETVNHNQTLIAKISVFSEFCQYFLGDNKSYVRLFIAVASGFSAVTNGV